MLVRRSFVISSVVPIASTMCDTVLIEPQREARWSRRTTWSRRWRAEKVRPSHGCQPRRNIMLKLLPVMRAALDVFENEPSVHSRLRSNPHVVSDSDGNSDAVWGTLFGVRG
jgi:hypothetical protein